MIRELLPLSAYEPAEQTSQLRMALVMSAMWGVPMTVFILAAADDVLGVVFSLGLGAAAALAFGFSWTYMFTRDMRKLVRRIYEGDPRIVPPPPAGEYAYRVSCSYLLSPRMAVGGHLYVGPGELTFAPHRKNLKRHQAPLSIPTTPQPVIEPVEVPQSRTMQLLGAPPAVSRLQVRASGTTATFAAPQPEQVAERLREYLRTAARG